MAHVLTMAVGTIEANMKNLKRILGTAIFAVAATLASAQSGGRESIFDDLTKQSVLSEMEQVLTSVAFVPGVDFATWPDMIAKYEEQINASESPEQFTRLVNRALMEFGFSHILLFSPVAAGRRATNSMVGIGVRIQLEEGGIRVVRVFEDGAAFAAGMMVGDLIFEADGRPIRNPRDLAGEEGEPVNIKIDRDGETIEMEIVRKKFRTIIPEELHWPEENVALLTIPTFDAAYNQERVRDLMKAAEGADNLILDVRGNGGGRVINLLHLSSFFLKRDQPLGTFVDRRVMERYKKDTGSETAELFEVAEWNQNKLRPMRRNVEPFAGNLVVLVDGATGSASEMIAAALRDQRNAKVVGMRSAGAALASTMRQLRDGYMLQFPLMDYVTIKGLRIEGIGIEPDVVAPNLRFGEKDIGVAEAIRIFKESRDGSIAA